MSYCRFSTDDYRCDVYVYEDVSGGFTTHVAARRHTLTGDELPPPSPKWSAPPTDDEIRAWYERCQKVSALLSDVEYVKIGLPHDGATFNDPTPGECAYRLEALRKLGYNVPQHAIDALLDEAQP